MCSRLTTTASKANLGKEQAATQQDVTAIENDPVETRYACSSCCFPSVPRLRSRHTSVSSMPTAMTPKICRWRYLEIGTLTNNLMARSEIKKKNSHNHHTLSNRKEGQEGMLTPSLQPSKTTANDTFGGSTVAQTINNNGKQLFL